MQEVFYEESTSTQNVRASKVKLNLFRVISIVSLLTAIVFFIMVFLSSTAFETIFTLVLGGLALFFYFFYNRKKDNFLVDFDYTFIIDNVRISKVLNSKRRKNLINFNTTEIITIGKVGSNTFERLKKDTANKFILATPNDTALEGKDFYYIHLAKSGERKLIVLECTELFVYNVLKASNKSVLEQDFNK